MADDAVTGVTGAAETEIDTSAMYLDAYLDAYLDDNLDLSFLSSAAERVRDNVSFVGEQCLGAIAEYPAGAAALCVASALATNLFSNTTVVIVGVTSLTVLAYGGQLYSDAVGHLIEPFAFVRT